MQIVGDATIVRCPCQGRADTARALRRITDRTHGFLRLRRRFDHRHQNCLRPYIQHLLDKGTVILTDANHRMAAAGENPQLRHDFGKPVRSVFGIDDEPVEPGSGANFRGAGMCQRHPKANLGLRLCKPRLEEVFR